MYKNEKRGGERRNELKIAEEEKEETNSFQRRREKRWRVFPKARWANARVNTTIFSIADKSYIALSVN